MLCAHPHPASLIIYSEPFICDEYAESTHVARFKEVCAAHPAYINASWLCTGISAVMRVCVSAHPVEPRVANVAEFFPTGTLPRKSGILNVVAPSPTQ